ncbi:hypothetical protein NEOC65_001401 [Neochlamydia sp. AcF65]|nr:hypothetical protein [Neochlamydia sp. AcF65]MBS4171652.1 hypothetical protein [Neochlamydia sp. AcF95]
MASCKFLTLSLFFYSLKKLKIYILSKSLKG